MSATVITASTAATDELSQTSASTSERDQDASKRLEAEEYVKSLLAKHNGSTKHPAVQEAIHSLASLNPTSNAGTSPWLQGEFLCHTLPEFPGRIKNSPPGTIQYTLGRLSFGIFQPHHLVCTVRSVRQSIQARASVKTTSGSSDKTKFQTFDYPICLDLTIHTPDGDLPAIMYHAGVCYKPPTAKQSKNLLPNRLNVTFKGSTLVPADEVRNDPALLQVWKDTFHNAYSNADAERGLVGKTLQSLLKWWFQMVLPSDSAVGDDLSVHFEMKRSPKGYLDVLYMSENLRITRGNRGTLVVVERTQSSSNPQQQSVVAMTE